MLTLFRLLVRPASIAAIPCLIGCASGQLTPIADHHQHLFSPDLAAVLATGNPSFVSVTARDVIANLDSAGIQKAILLGTAYLYGSPSRNFPDEYARVRAENDWDAAQAAQYPGRLIAFCGFNPLKDYALEELERCSKDSRLNRGIKLHFGNSDVQVDNPQHVQQLAKVFRAANAHHMAIVIHMRASISRKRPYGARQAQIFLDQLLPEAPDVVVQVRISPAPALVIRIRPPTAQWPSSLPPSSVVIHAPGISGSTSPPLSIRALPPRRQQSSCSAFVRSVSDACYMDPTQSLRESRASGGQHSVESHSPKRSSRE